MEVIDTGCPIVLKPSKERIAASLKKMGKQLPVHEGLVQGGVYPWLSKESLEAKGQVRKEQIVQEIRRKNDRDLKKLLQQHRIDYETTTERLEKFKNSLVYSNYLELE